jgi:hypothetical protein
MDALVSCDGLSRHGAVGVRVVRVTHAAFGQMARPQAHRDPIVRQGVARVARGVE